MSDNVVQLGDHPRAAPVEDNRPVVRITADNLSEVANASEMALLAGKEELYQRGGQIVYVDTVIVKTPESGELMIPSIKERGDNSLAEDLSNVIRYEKYDSKSKNWKTVEPPIRTVKILKERGGKLRLPPLSGFTSVPPFRRDGSIYYKPGYDKQTGLLYIPDDSVLPLTKDQPTIDDARGAVVTLYNLVRLFPFASQEDAAVMMAAIITAVVRNSLPNAPLFGFDAPTAGSGKSMLVDICSVIATGREAGVMSQGKSIEEMEKRLDSALIDGSPVIAIDNCELPIGGDKLCSMLSATTIRLRPLGESKIIELPTRVFITATGNNLTLNGDITRRALVSRLDPKEERPELRKFDVNPIEVAKANRGTYIAAALTILKAYIVAGRPRQADPLGSFEDWSNLVRSALLWIDVDDPILVMERTRKGDPQLINLQSVMVQWRKVIRGRVPVGDAIRIATDKTAAAHGNDRDSTFVNIAFRDALILVAVDTGGRISPVRLGKWLARHANRLITIEVEGGTSVQCYFQECGVLGGSMTWALLEKT